MSYNINNSNLLIYYPFDTTTSNYATGSPVNDATTPLTVSTSATKLSSGSLYFPGTDQTTKVKAVNTTFTTNGITFALWFKNVGSIPGSNNALFDFGMGTNNNGNIMFFFGGTGGQLSVVAYSPLTSTTGTITNTPVGFTLYDNNWHHYVLTISSGGTWTAWVDGIQYSSPSWTVVPSTSTRTFCQIGTNNFGNTPINGYMNQFVVFNRVLTTSEIRLLAYYPSQISFSSSTSSTFSVPLSSTYNINNTNLLHYYPFDFNYANYATGVGVNNATTTNVTISTSSTKLSSGSILFPGASATSQLVQIPSTTLTTNGVTFAFWAKINLQSGVSPQFIFDFASGAAANTVGMWLSGTGGFLLMLYNPSSGTGNSYGLNYTLADSNWHHYCITVVTSGVWSFYVDGVSISISITAYPTLSAMTTPYIGANHLGNANINGNLNQFLVFNRALAPVEISYLANYPSQVQLSGLVTGPVIQPYNVNNSGLLQYYPFNTDLNNYSTGTSVAPSSIDTNTSYSVANTKTGTGSVYFGPSNTNGITLPVFTLGTAGITVTMWIKFVDITTRTSSTRIFEFANGSGTSQQFFSFIINSTFNSLSISLEGNVVYSYSYSVDTNWHHYCISINSSGQIIIYVDGVQLGTTQTYASYSSVYSSALTTAQIGGPAPTYSAFSVGMKYAYMNQFLCFRRVITATELSYLVNYPSQVGFSSAVTTPGIPPYPCFLQGSKILRLDPETDIESYVPIEHLRPGDLIRTFRNGHKAIFHIGKKTLPRPVDDPDPRNRLYRFPKSISPGMTADLYITGEHCILHKSISEELKERVRKHMGDVYITEYQYRVPACIDDRAEPYTGYNDSKGPVTIWHFALENHSIYRNYGVYANGLLVESCSIEHLVNKSEMILM